METFICSFCIYSHKKGNHGILQSIMMGSIMACSRTAFPFLTEIVGSHWLHKLLVMHPVHGLHKC